MSDRNINQYTTKEKCPKVSQCSIALVIQALKILTEVMTVHLNDLNRQSKKISKTASLLFLLYKEMESIFSFNHETTENCAYFLSSK